MLLTLYRSWSEIMNILIVTLFDIKTRCYEVKYRIYIHVYASRIQEHVLNGEVIFTFVLIQSNFHVHKKVLNADMWIRTSFETEAKIIYIPVESIHVLFALWNFTTRFYYILTNTTRRNQMDYGWIDFGFWIFLPK